MTARPFPPADIATREPIIEIVATGTEMCRFYSNSHGSIYFAMDAAGRLNAPDGSYGTLYAARAADGAFAEIFLRNVGMTALNPVMVGAKGMVRIAALKDLRFACLYGPGLSILGATAEVTHSSITAYDLSQAWSKAIYDHPADVDGIAYRSRHDDNEICYAIFDRAQLKIKVSREQTDLDEEWFWELLVKYKVGFLS